MSEALSFFVVDDDAGVLQVLRELVAAATHCTLWGTAGSGEEALARLAECGDEAPDVVLLDVELPGIDGIDTARRHLAGHPLARIVLMSAHTLDDLPADLLAGGVTAFLHKSELSPKALADLR